jgi:hypothetical protein
MNEGRTIHVKRTAQALVVGLGSAVSSVILYCVWLFADTLVGLSSLSPVVGQDMTVSSVSPPSSVVTATVFALLASLCLGFVCYRFGRRHKGGSPLPSVAIVLGAVVALVLSAGIGLRLDQSPDHGQFGALAILPGSGLILPTCIVMLLPGLVAAAALWAGARKTGA